MRVICFVPFPPERTLRKASIVVLRFLLEFESLWNILRRVLYAGVRIINVFPCTSSPAHTRSLASFDTYVSHHMVIGLSRNANSLSDGWKRLLLYEFITFFSLRFSLSLHKLPIFALPCSMPSLTFVTFTPCLEVPRALAEPSIDVSENA